MDATRVEGNEQVSNVEVTSTSWLWQWRTHGLVGHDRGQLRLAEGGGMMATVRWMHAALVRLSRSGVEGERRRKEMMVASGESSEEQRLPWIL